MTAAPFLKNALNDVQPNGGNVVLTDAATFNVDLAAGNFLNEVTLGGSRTITFTNGIVGVVYMLKVIQDATGSRALSKGTGVLFAGGSLSLTATAAAFDLLAVMLDVEGNYNVWIEGKAFA